MTRSPLPAKQPKPKTRPCAICREKFVTRHSFHKLCGKLECAIAFGEKSREKSLRIAAKVERADIKRRKQAIKTIPQLKAELQAVFNLCMRLEDEAAGNGCICCGKFPTAAALSQLGGAWDACHYRSRGSADHLRYNEDNVWRGLKDCNTWGHTDYRGGLVKRIGIERVEAVESNQTGMKWTREWLIEQKAIYAARALKLKKELK